MSLIKTLQEKGFKVGSDDEEAGMKLFKTQKQRLTKPQITNSKLLRS
jgi:hypothetical protein